MTLLTHWEGEPVGVLAHVWGVPRVEAYDSIESTNDRARDLAADGAAPFTVVLADEQTSGRGRSGARWHDTPAASLLVSVLLPRGGVALHVPLLVGVAVARAVEQAASGLDVRVKWPNDIIIDGRKAGGILCEATRAGVVAGVGVNVRQRPEDFPEEVRDQAVSLESALGSRVSRSLLAAGLLRELSGLFATPGRPRLSDALHRELTARDALRDRAVQTVQEGPGTARGIDSEGALLLERPDGSRVRVLAGGVRVR